MPQLQEKVKSSFNPHGKHWSFGLNELTKEKKTKIFNLSFLGNAHIEFLETLHSGRDHVAYKGRRSFSKFRSRCQEPRHTVRTEPMTFCSAIW